MLLLSLQRCKGASGRSKLEAFQHFRPSLERQDLSCTYLAHHELESVIIIIIIIVRPSLAPSKLEEDNERRYVSVSYSAL